MVQPIQRHHSSKHQVRKNGMHGKHLYNANHTFELPQTNTTHLRITKQQMGVGGINSWGAKVQPQYLIDQSKNLDFTCTLYISKKD